MLSYFADNTNLFVSMQLYVNISRFDKQLGTIIISMINKLKKHNSYHVIYNSFVFGRW